MFKDGNAIITWTQNRYDASSMPLGFNVENYLDAQDIWLGIYDAGTNSITDTLTITDAIGDRAEGEAKVSAGKGDDALITWVVEDPNANTTDVYYVNVSKSGGVWSMTSPQKIWDLSGFNYDVEVSYADSTNAVACWINDPDGNDTTTVATQVYSSKWDGSSWLTPSILYPLQQRLEYKHISVSFNKQYGAFGYTASISDSTGKFTEFAGADIYDNVSDTWINGSFEIVDSTSNSFDRPVIGVDETGLVSFTYQQVAMFNDTLKPDEGEVTLWLNNLTNANGWQKAVSNTNLVNDSNVFVNSMDVAWGKNSNIYFLTQESDTTVGNNPQYLPANGILFGNPSQGLVLRAAQVSSSLVLSAGNLPSASCVPTGIKEFSPNNNNKINYPEIKNFPNPASDYEVFEYVLHDKSDVKLEILDLQGQLLETIINQTMGAGRYRSIFNTSNLSNGVYLYKVNVNGYVITRKLIIAK